MSRGVNKVILVGHLGADPEVRYTAAGKAITNVRIATSEQWTDANGERQERTEWHSLAFFGRLAEVAGEYLKKGSQIYVEGKLKTDKYTGQDGIERYSTKVIVGEMQMLGGQQQGGQQQDQGRGNGRAQQRQAPERPQAPPDDFEDSIPF